MQQPILCKVRSHLAWECSLGGLNSWKRFLGDIIVDNTVPASRLGFRVQAPE